MVSFSTVSEYQTNLLRDGQYNSKKDLQEVVSALDVLQQSFVSLKEKGDMALQPRFVRDSVWELTRTREMSISRFCQVLIV